MYIHREWKGDSLGNMFKAWAPNTGYFPRLLWPLLVYEVPLSTVEAVEWKMNNFLRRWLAVPRRFCSIGLQRTDSRLQLSVTSEVEGYKLTQAGKVMMLQHSKNERVRQA